MRHSETTMFFDDSLLLGQTEAECRHNIEQAVSLMQRLGFIVHPLKSVLNPTQQITFLGNVIDSNNMIVFLPEEENNYIAEECLRLSKKGIVSIRDLAHVIGLLISSFSAVDYGPLFYRDLEKGKIKALKENNGNIDKFVKINSSMLSELSWWCFNIHTQTRAISHGNPDVTITTDSSLEGWGAILSPAVETMLNE